MEETYYYPEKLAHALLEELGSDVTSAPSLQLLTRIFETLYFTSFRTEESHPIRATVIFMDSADIVKAVADGHSGRVKGWSYVPLNQPLTLTTQDLAKIALASDPRSSSLVVSCTQDDSLIIVGLVDQAHLIHNFMNYDSEEKPDRPGMFQASIIGAGHLAAYIAYNKVAELKDGRILNRAINIFAPNATVCSQLKTGEDSYISTIRDKVGLSGRPGLSLYEATLRRTWLASISRILLRIQNYRHGGAVLIATDSNFVGLGRKYPIRYSRLRTALESFGTAQIRAYQAWNEISTHHLADDDGGSIPERLYFHEFHNETILDDARTEVVPQ